MANLKESVSRFEDQESGEVVGQCMELGRYFPVTLVLTREQLDLFDELIVDVCSHSNFDLQLIGEGRSNRMVQMPRGVVCLVAGHLVEVFFFRSDVLAHLLTKPLRVRLYTTKEAYFDDGGKGGGMYDPGRKSLHLVLSRLFEGFSGERPGVAPFLHELGHLLDYSCSSGGIFNRSRGLLPGLNPDGVFYRPKARELFLRGKRLELERYLACVDGRMVEDQLPIGSPYVFRRDTEFIAGYFEMFFRNPNYFASQNADLYQSFAEIFGWDPRLAWSEDFPGYLEKNRRFYLSGQRPPSPGISVPEK